MCVVVMQGEGLGVDEGPAGPACHRAPPVRLAGLHRPHPAVRGADRWGSLPHLLDDVAADTMGVGGPASTHEADMASCTCMLPWDGLRWDR